VPGRRLSPEGRRAQIIEAVEELFKSRSFAEIGVPEVAKLVGITQGLVYHYFPTKEALLIAAVELRANELLQYCLPDPSEPLLVQIERGVRGYVDYVEAHSLAYGNLFNGPSAAEPEILRICEETRKVLIDRFLVALGIAQLALPATRLSLRGYFGYSESVILKWLERRQVPRTTIERMCYAAILSALRVGLSSDPEVPLSPTQLAALETSFKRHFSLA
jgi:AcrR family transcriptional regulator